MTSHNKSILVVEDNAQIRNYLSHILKQAGFPCISSGTAQDALALLVCQPVDLILLDLGLPDLDGMEVIGRIREWSQLPILVVSARDQDHEKVAALDAGADDYLTKPFSATELLARIRVALRHASQMAQLQRQPVLRVGELAIDLDKHLVTSKGAALHLTPLEYRLLSLLFKNMGKVLTTQYILKALYGADCGTDTQALRALMAGLRRKIEDVPAKPRYIFTEIGVGYRLAEE